MNSCLLELPLEKLLTHVLISRKGYSFSRNEIIVSLRNDALDVVGATTANCLCATVKGPRVSQRMLMK